MSVHKLKTWPEYFKHVIDGSKSFEYRQNDRDYHVEDILILQEYDILTQKYTGRECSVIVTYILKLPEDYAILGIKKIGE